MPAYRVTRQSSVAIEGKTTTHTMHASSNALSGTLECVLDTKGRPRLDRPYKATLELPVESIKTGIGLQDREMRRRFDVKRFPNITARLRKATQVEPGVRYVAVADLSMHGTTRRFESEVRLRIGQRRLTIDGEQVIDMRDFGIDPPRLIILTVDPEVTVRVHIVATLQD
jgi:polyisoprenoid-binding protein YceI